MKKKFLSLMVAVAMLFSIVTFVVQADTDGEGDYFYFDIEHFAEDDTKEIYMTPIKIYTNGFYDYSGEFKLKNFFFISLSPHILFSTYSISPYFILILSSFSSIGSAAKKRKNTVDTA